METGIRCRLATVIVSYNSAVDIELSVLSALRFCGENDLVIVIDNASIDDTPIILKRLAAIDSRLRVTLLDCNIGFGPANNKAFKLVHSEWYFLLNADAWLVRDSVTPAITVIQDDQIIGVCGVPLIFPDGRPQTFAFTRSTWRKWLLQILGVRNLVSRLAGFPIVKLMLAKLPMGRQFVTTMGRPVITMSENDFPEGFSPTWRIENVDWICGAAMLLRGDFVRQSGGFDPEIFLYGEDEDLCLQASKLGRRVVWVETWPVVHVFGWGMNRFDPVVAELKFRSLTYFIKKHFGASTEGVLMRILLPLHVYGWWRFLYVFN